MLVNKHRGHALECLRVVSCNAKMIPCHQPIHSSPITSAVLQLLRRPTPEKVKEKCNALLADDEKEYEGQSLMLWFWKLATEDAARLVLRLAELDAAPPHADRADLQLMYVKLTMSAELLEDLCHAAVVDYEEIHLLEVRTCNKLY